MKIAIHRGQKVYGPYPIEVVQRFLTDGKLLPHDLARLESDGSTNVRSLSEVLRQHAPQALSALKAENPLTTIRSLGLRLIFPLDEIRGFGWLRDTRFLYLAIAGLLPFLIQAIEAPMGQKYYMVSAYFSLVWAIVFVTTYRTSQIELKYAAATYLFTAFVGISLFPYLVEYSPTATNTYKFLYELKDGKVVHRTEGPFSELLIGYTLGVGFHEEFIKALVIFFIATRPGKLMMPQTLVVYGLMSGLGFGIKEGVDYIDTYMTSFLRNTGALIDAFNSNKIDAKGLLGNIYYLVGGNFLLTLLRLTALPLFHAAWTGIASYYIAFAALHPRKKWGLWILAIVVPGVIHGVYDTCASTGSEWGVVAMATLGFVLLAVYLRTAGKLQKGLIQSQTASMPSSPSAG